MSNFRLSISDYQFPIISRKIPYIVILFTFFVCLPFSIQAEGGDKKIIRARAENGYQSISDATFREIFRDYLCQHLGKEESDVVVSKLKVIGKTSVPAGKIHIRLFQKNKRKLTGYIRLVAIISVNGVVKSKVKLSGWVDVFESVVCARRNFKKGDTIQKDDFYVARKNISHLSSKTVTDIGKVVGLMVRHTIKKDSCIKEWMLEKPLIVKRGDMITILAESENLKVTAPGRVLVKGHMGELIRVQNAMSKKIIYARVINNSTVNVDF
jgi:flagella basal body P-ring formation protein FlgA